MTAPRPRTITFAVVGPIGRADLPGLCARIHVLVQQSNAELAWCDVRRVAADAVTVEALGRLQLAARRQRCQVRLRNASHELLELVAFMGLDDVLPEWEVESE
jgi:ABC-type transporter Mla MlaB component